MKTPFYENKSRPIQISGANDLTPSPHFHKEIEMIYVRRGGCVAHGDRFCARMQEGDLFISFPNQIHYYESCQIGDYYLGIFSPDIFFSLREVLHDQYPKQNVISLSREDPLRELLERSASRRGEYRRCAMAGDLHLIMSELLPRLNLKPRASGENSSLKSLLEYCAASYRSDLSLDDAAEALHLSRYHLSHLINTKLGMGFNAYINTLRVNAASTLLSSTSMRTTDVAGEVGFGSIRSFNRAFREVTGMSPLDYRKLTYREENN